MESLVRTEAFYKMLNALKKAKVIVGAAMVDIKIDSLVRVTRSNIYDEIVEAIHLAEKAE